MKKFMGRTMAKMNENRRNGRKALKGFTLVEIIVVLVILAILAAAMIPALTGYIDKARTRTAIAEARNVLTAAQTLASEEYGLHGTSNLTATWGSSKSTAILDLADVTGENKSVKSITFDKAKILTLTYDTPDYTVVYDSSSEDVFTVTDKKVPATPTTSATPASEGT